MPYITYLLLYTVVACRFLGVSVTEIIQSFYNGHPVGHSWYIIASLIFYLFFYLCYHRVDLRNKAMLKRANLRLLFCTVGYMIATWYTMKVSNWYISCPFFFVGIMFCLEREKIEKVLAKHYALLFAGAVIIFAGSYMITVLIHHYTNIRVWEFLKVVAEICFMLVCILMLEKVSFVNWLTAFLGKISFELYICHGLIIQILFGGGTELLDTGAEMPVYCNSFRCGSVDIT